MTYLQFVNERQEQIALQSILIQSIWSPVGGADQNQTILPQPTEQPVQDCGVGHIIDEELVQAQHFAFPGHRVGNLDKWIVVAVILLQAGVHIQHKVVEVRALQLQTQNDNLLLCADASQTFGLGTFAVAMYIVLHLQAGTKACCEVIEMCVAICASRGAYFSQMHCILVVISADWERTKH